MKRNLGSLEAAAAEYSRIGSLLIPTASPRLYRNAIFPIGRRGGTPPISPCSSRTGSRPLPSKISQDYNNRSAITFVKNIHTPVLFVLGESDYRTPQDSGGEQLFRALKYLKRPTAMVVFPRETHELSRSGEPWHRIERLDHIVGWFDKWMMGVPHPEYDINPPTAATARSEH